jgi:hypothetical protein
MFDQTPFFFIMIDIELIKETYGRMPDEKLAAFLEHDAMNISYQAFILLKSEYTKRKLDPSLLLAVESSRVEQSKQKIRVNFFREGDKENKRLSRRVFEMKASGKTNGQIIDMLIDNNIDSGQAFATISHLHMIAQMFYNSARKKMMYSSFAFFLGLLMLLGSMNMRLSGNLGFIGAVLVLLGIGFFFGNKKMYRISKKAIHAIEVGYTTE